MDAGLSCQHVRSITLLGKQYVGDCGTWIRYACLLAPDLRAGQVEFILKVNEVIYFVVKSYPEITNVEGALFLPSSSSKSLKTFVEIFSLMDVTYLNSMWLTTHTSDGQFFLEAPM